MTSTPTGAATPLPGVAALGTFEFGTPALPADRARRLLDTYQELGGWLIDTAPTYGPHGGAFLAEPLIGAWLHAAGAPGMRVITKAGLDPARPDQGDLRPETILASARRSADRLGRPTILVLHRDDPAVPVDEIADAAERTAREGLAERVGASNWTTARLEAWATYAAAARLTAPTLTAPLWSLAARADPPAEPWLVEADRAHLDMAARHGMTVTPYRTLAAGYLAARHSGRHTAHHSAAYDTEAGRERRARLHQAAAALRMTPHGLALAWLRAHRPAPVIPVIGPRTHQQLAESMVGAAQAERVTPALAAYLQAGP
ncbi:aldo/keto reductase [Streptomyces lavendulocolor]|uniref:aldo/keto reductase n=1 Tax=Streptomyces lavendulocolor TaxID=67316 RepID=UPI00167B62A7|nr:NADP-dependent aryl-alcohol dehydrogenase [Streptomyces cellulosae]